MVVFHRKTPNYCTILIVIFEIELQFEKSLSSFAERRNAIACCAAGGKAPCSAAPYRAKWPLFPNVPTPPLPRRFWARGWSSSLRGASSSPRLTPGWSLPFPPSTPWGLGTGRGRKVPHPRGHGHQQTGGRRLPKLRQNGRRGQAGGQAALLRPPGDGGKPLLLGHALCVLQQQGGLGLWKSSAPAAWKLGRTSSA